MNEANWKQNTFYLVKVAWNLNNPIHPAIFYSGFLDDKGQPGSYSCIFNPSYGWLGRGELAYFEVVREVISNEEWKVAQTYQLPKEVQSNGQTNVSS